MMNSQSTQFCKILLPILSAFSIAKSEDYVIPVSLPINRYLAIWENSPFLRKLNESTPLTIKSSFGGTLVLEGLVSDTSRGTVAYVRETEKGITLVVTEKEGDDHPYFLVAASQVNNPALSWVRISDGRETVDLGFDGHMSPTEMPPTSTAPTGSVIAAGHPSITQDTTVRPPLEVPKTTVSGPAGQRMRFPAPPPKIRKGPVQDTERPDPTATKDSRN